MNFKKHFLVRALSILFFSIAIFPSSYGAANLDYSFYGVEGEMLDNVKKRILIAEKQEISVFTGESIESFYKKVPEEIKQAIQPFGYFSPKISSNLNVIDGKWKASFHISTGNPVRITFLDLKIIGQGSLDPAFTDVIKKPPLKQGRILQTEKYKALKQSLFDLALSNGYLSSVMDKSTIKIDLKDNSAFVTIHFNTGNRYKFGRVNFITTKFDKNFLKRFLPFKEGDFYSAKKIEELQLKLSDSNFFQQVEIIPKKDEAKEYAVPIDINLVPRKSRQYDLGLGFGTDTGARGLLGLESRNLGSKGQIFKTFIKASERQNNLEAHYIIPGRNPEYDQYDFSVLFENQNQKYGDSRVVKVSAGYLTKLFNDWKTTFGVGLQKEHYNFEGQQPKNSLFLIPNITLSRTSSDSPINTKRGNRIDINIRGSKRILLSDIDFLQTKVDGKYICPLGSRNALVLRGTIGYTMISDLYDVPLSLQYFTGGAQSVRGYGYNSLGPGRNLTVTSAEFRQKINQNWYAAAFLDAGNVNSSFNMKLNRGVGVGVVRSLPIGNLALSYAKALDLKGTPGMIQFSIGPEF